MIQPINKNKKSIKKENQLFTLLVDGNSLLKMSLVDKRMNSKGEEYGAIFVFLRQLGHLLEKKDFNFCVVCYDGYNSGILRYNYYKDYKANRDKHYEMAGAGTTDYDKNINDYVKKVLNYSRSNKKELKRVETDDECFQRQREILQNILENLYVRQFMYDDVEGDDLIAYYVKNKLPNENIVIVSGDRDLTQLISDDVCQYIPSLKKFISPKNSAKELGITHENTVLKKIICGDSSDNIKGIKGIGEQTLVKLFPELIENKSDLEAVIARSKELLSERKEQKKKPLRALENIINGVTDGSQGKDIYEINKKIIDLSEPLLTDEALNALNDEIRAPLSDEGRSIKNIYEIIEENGMNYIMDNFGEIFGKFERIIKTEKKYSKNMSR